MIYSLAGKIEKKNPTEVILHLNGISYALTIPVSTFEKIGSAGAACKLFTYLHVREDILKLYGFFTEIERTLFKTVISVSGIGPSLGLSILSGSTVADFKYAILSEDLTTLTGIPGIGKKTAQRMIVELKEKMNIIKTGDKILDLKREDTGSPIKNDAIAALISLGIKPKSAQESVEKTIKDIGQDSKVEELIRQSLKRA